VRARAIAALRFAVERAHIERRRPFGEELFARRREWLVSRSSRAALGRSQPTARERSTAVVMRALNIGRFSLIALTVSLERAASPMSRSG
jgi:hypothetical protein